MRRVLALLAGPVLPGLAVWATLFAIYLTWIAFLDHAGALPPRVAELWGQAIATTEGAMPVAQILTIYPPLPVFISTGWQWAFGLSGVPSPVVAAAAMAALIGVSWLVALRRAGLGLPGALAGMVMLAVHPYVLWMVCRGPGPVMSLAAHWAVAIGLIRLRRRGAAPDAALVAIALAVLAFAAIDGLLFAVAALPVLALAAPREMLGRAPVGLLLLLLFPLLVGLGSAEFLALLFGGDPAAPFAALGADITAALSNTPPLPWWLALVALVSGMPILLGPILAGWSMRPLQFLALALAGLPLLALLLDAVSASAARPLSLVVPALAMAAAAACLVARELRRPLLALGVLAAGVVGGTLSLAFLPEPDLIPMREALSRGRTTDRPEIKALSDLAGAMAGRDDIAVDIRAVPALVAARGTTRGLIGPNDSRFVLAVTAGRLDLPFVAVRHPGQGVESPDRVNTAFPTLHENGTPGYALVHEGGPWRLYARALPDAESPRP